MKNSLPQQQNYEKSDQLAFCVIYNHYKSQIS